jgi:hypothetical protein
MIYIIVVMGFELGFCATPPALFHSGYFEDWILLFAWTDLDHDPPIFMLPAIAGMTSMYHHTQLFSIEMGSHKLFCPGWSGTVIF